MYKILKFPVPHTLTPDPQLWRINSTCGSENKPNSTEGKTSLSVPETEGDATELLQCTKVGE